MTSLTDLLDNLLPVPSVPPPPPRRERVPPLPPTDLEQRISEACLYLDRLRLRGGANARQLAKVRHFLETGEKRW